MIEFKSWRVAACAWLTLSGQLVTAAPTPVVVDGVMYVTGPWSIVYALDARTGPQLWIFDLKVEGAWARKACCDVVNRGVAVWQGKVYVGTLDGYLVALDARDGQVKWRIDTLTDRSRAYVVNGAPAIAGDKVVIGNAGADLGVRGYVSAAAKTWYPHSRWASQRV